MGDPSLHMLWLGLTTDTQQQCCHVFAGEEWLVILGVWHLYAWYDMVCLVQCSVAWYNMVRIMHTSINVTHFLLLRHYELHTELSAEMHFIF